MDKNKILDKLFDLITYMREEYNLYRFNENLLLSKYLPINLHDLGEDYIITGSFALHLYGILPDKRVIGDIDLLCLDNPDNFMYYNPLKYQNLEIIEEDDEYIQKQCKVKLDGQIFDILRTEGEEYNVFIIKKDDKKYAIKVAKPYNIIKCKLHFFRDKDKEDIEKIIEKVYEKYEELRHLKK